MKVAVFGLGREQRAGRRLEGRREERRNYQEYYRRLSCSDWIVTPALMYGIITQIEYGKIY